MISHLTMNEQRYIDEEVKRKSKNIMLAYVLCIFLGVFGVHRYYLNKPASALIMTLLSFSFFGMLITAFWTLFDLFLIPGIINKSKQELKSYLIRSINSRRSYH